MECGDGRGCRGGLYHPPVSGGLLRTPVWDALWEGGEGGVPPKETTGGEA